MATYYNNVSNSLFFTGYSISVIINQPTSLGGGALTVGQFFLSNSTNLILARFGTSGKYGSSGTSMAPGLNGTMIVAGVVLYTGPYGDHDAVILTYAGNWSL